LFTCGLRRDLIEGVDHHEDSGLLVRLLVGHDDVDSGRHALRKVGEAFVMKGEDNVGAAFQMEPDPFR
jgi:hypothetical protein